MATCVNCGKTFSPSRGDARYCSNRCKLVTFRQGVEMATIVKHHISFGTTLNGEADERLRLRELMNVYPDAFRSLGEPMIRAALATTLPKMGCRWDLAYMWASRLDQPKPKLSRARRTLLGEPCPRCTKRMQPAKSPGGAAQTDVGRSVRRASSTPLNRVASPDPRVHMIHDPFGTCSTCRDYRRAHPGAAALTASGAPEGVPPAQLERAAQAGSALVVVVNVGGGRRYPSDVGRDTPDHSTAAPAIGAHLDIRVGDRVRCCWEVSCA